MEHLDYHIAGFEQCEAIDLREWKNFVIFEFKRSIVSLESLVFQNICYSINVAMRMQSFLI